MLVFAVLDHTVDHWQHCYEKTTELFLSLNYDIDKNFNQNTKT
jgi:hypothetical protein